MLRNNIKRSVCSKGTTNETFEFKIRADVAIVVCLVLSHVCDMEGGRTRF